MTNAEQVRTERERAGWSIDTLALLSGVAPETIEAIEAGTLKPLDSEIEAMEEAFAADPPLDWWKAEAVTNADALGYLARRIARSEGLEGRAVTDRIMQLEDEAKAAAKA